MMPHTHLKSQQLSWLLKMILLHCWKRYLSLSYHSGFLEILEWLKESGNDLITPHPEFGFPGLKDGDGWCVCASWYARAVEAGKGCPIFLKRTHKSTLKHLPIEILKKFAIDLS